MDSISIRTGGAAPAGQPAPLPLDVYAVAAARLLHAAGEPAGAALAALGIPDDTFRASAAVWERAIDEELARGGDSLLAAFAARLVAARAALARRAAPPSGAHPLDQDHASPGLPRGELPDLPVVPETRATDAARIARPAIPFPSGARRPPLEDQAARRAAAGYGLPFSQAAGPAASPAEEPVTVRLLDRSPWPAGGPAPAPPLARVSPASAKPTLIRRIARWLRGAGRGRE